MGALSQLIRPATKAAGVPSISSDGTFAVAPWFSWLPWVNTRSGTAVNEDTALALPTLFACVRVLAESVASLPLIVYRRLPNGGKDRFTDHPLYPVLHDQPNPEMTSFGWRETVMGHLGTWGNTYNEVAEDRSGRQQIWPLSPRRMTVKWEGGRKVFDYYRADGTVKRMTEGTIFHIPGLSMDGLIGMSPVATHRETLGEATATRAFGSAFYRNSARPAIVMEHPSTLSPGAIERLATQMDQLRGSGNAGKTVVMEEGLKVHEVGVPPEDAQYLETRKLQREDIAALYRMPQHMVGIMDHATYANIEQESINFVVNTLRPWLVRIEQAIKVYFFADEPDVFAEFLIDGLLRGDAAARASSLATQLEHGVITENEWRGIENRNPYEVDRRWSPVANYVAEDIDEDGNPIEEAAPVAEQPPVDEAAPVGPPQLFAVKSVEGVRCKGLFRGAPCNRFLGDLLTPPYRLTCPRCKSVTEATAEPLPEPEPAISISPVLKAMAAAMGEDAAELKRQRDDQTQQDAEHRDQVAEHRAQMAEHQRQIVALVKSVQGREERLVQAVDAMMDGLSAIAERPLQVVLPEPRPVFKRVVRADSGALLGVVEEPA